MADLEKTVAVLFKGVDEISGTMNSISGSLGTFGGKLEAATQPLASMALGVEKVGIGLAALAAGGLVYAFNKYSELSSAVAELDKVLGDNAEGLAAAKQNAFELSEQYGASMVDIVGSTADFIQAGFTVEESMKLVKNSMDLAIAGNIEAGTASEYLVRTLKGFKAPAEDAARLVDILNEVSNVYATDVNQLADGMSKISPIANTMGLSFEETAALLTPIIEVFGSGAEAADALKIGLLKLGDDSKPVTDALYNMGIAQKDYNGQLRPTKDILADVQAKFTTLTAEQKLFYTSQLVGLEQAPRMIEVFNGGAKAAEVLKTALHSAGSAAEEVAKQLATPEKQLAILRQSFVNLAEAIGEKYGNSATQVISASNSIVVALQTALGEGAFASILSEIDSFLGEFSTYLKEVAKAAPEALKNIDYTDFIQSFKDLGGSIGDLFKAIFGNFDLTKPEDLAKALQKVVDAGTKLVEFSTGIAEGLKPFTTQMGEWINKAISADSETTKLAGSAAGFGQGVNALVNALGFVGPALSIFSGALVIDAVATLGKLAAGLAALPAAPVVAVGAALLGVAYAANSLNPPIDLATAKFDEFGNLIGDFDNMAEPAKDGIKEIGASMKDLPEVKTFTINGETGSATEKINSLNTSVLSFPPSFTTEANAETQDAQEKFAALWMYLNDMPQMTKLEILAETQSVENAKRLIEGLPPMKEITIDLDTAPIGAASALLNDIPRTYTADFMAEANEESIEKTKLKFEEIVNPDGTKTWVSVGVDPDSMKRTEAALKEIPTEKMLEIKLKGEIDKELETIKANADTVQKAMEWTAKVEIANVEADAKRMEAAFGSVSSEIGSLSNELGDLFSKNWSDFDITQFVAVRDAAAQALKLQKEAHEANMKLVEEQIQYEIAKVQRMKSNKALITIDSTGLEPALEQIMWQILQKVQLKANEEHASFLLGIPS